MRMTPKKSAKVPICRNNILVVKLLLFILDLELCSNHVMLVLNLQGSLRDTQAGLPTNHKDILLALLGCPCQGHWYHCFHHSSCHWAVSQKQGYCPLWSFLASLLSLLSGLHLRWHLHLLKNSKTSLSLYQCVQQSPSSQHAMCQSQHPIRCL